MHILSTTRLPRTLARSRIAAVAACLWASAASGQSIDRLEQSVWGQVGAFRANVDSRVRIDYIGDPVLGVPATGTTLDFEDDLGLRGHDSAPGAMFGLRLSERWRIEIEAYRLRRSATQTVRDEEIVIDGTVYAASAQLQSSFDSSVVRASLGYSFHKSPAGEAGMSLGVQYTKYRLAFAGEGRFDGEPPATRSVEESDSGPLPTIGLYGTAGLGGGWSLAAKADYLPVDSSRIKGYVGNLEANVYYRLSPHWSAGLGYRAVEYQVERKSSGDIGARFEYRLRGPQLLLEAGF